MFSRRGRGPTRRRARARFRLESRPRRGSAAVPRGGRSRAPARTKARCSDQDGGRTPRPAAPAHEARRSTGAADARPARPRAAHREPAWPGYGGGGAAAAGRGNGRPRSPRHVDPIEVRENGRRELGPPTQSEAVRHGQSPPPPPQPPQRPRLLRRRTKSRMTSPRRARRRRRLRVQARGVGEAAAGREPRPKTAASRTAWLVAPPGRNERGSVLEAAEQRPEVLHEGVAARRAKRPRRGEWPRSRGSRARMIRKPMLLLPRPSATQILAPARAISAISARLQPPVGRGPLWPRLAAGRAGRAGRGTRRTGRATSAAVEDIGGRVRALEVAEEGALDGALGDVVGAAARATARPSSGSRGVPGR